jgi:TfoX/Sxy family transcriptional regulator of competence genes
VEAAYADVQPTQMFGSAGLKADGKTFAMIVKGRLVVKLPRDRVQHLVDSGAGQLFDPGHGRQMKQWISLAPADPSTCRALITEALTFRNLDPPVTPAASQPGCGPPVAVRGKADGDRPRVRACARPLCVRGHRSTAACWLLISC